MWHILLATIFILSPPISNAYPAYPPAFAFQPSQQQLAMAAAGLEPIMPVNYPGMTPMTGIHARHGMMSSPLPYGAAGRGDAQQQQQQFQQLSMAMHNQQQPAHLFIRNSPYQPSPIHGFSASPFAAAGLQQPFFPQGMAIGKSPFGVHPSSAVLPGDIPMDVLIGRQIVQNGLDDMGQSAASSSSSSSSSAGRHPFPLSPLIGANSVGADQMSGPGGGPSSSSFGGAFGPDPFQQQQRNEQPEEKKQEFEEARREQMPPNPPPSTLPASPSQSPFDPSPVISAESKFNSGSSSGAGPASSPYAAPETPSTQQSSSLPVFLRGAPQEHIDEFKRIIRQANSTYADQVSQIDMLVQKMDSERQLMYREFMRENDERERVHRDRVHKTVSEMSDKAQEQFAKISATLRNPNMADQERWDRVLQLYGKMDTDLRNEFEQKFKGFPTISQPNGMA